MGETTERNEWAELQRAVARLRASVMAVTFGLAGGATLFVATVWLLIRGGEPVGPHLALLNNFFPGYSVTWLGAPIGFLYGVLVGAAVGWILARVYNSIADRRDPNGAPRRSEVGQAPGEGEAMA
jgi:hypothetical protein